MFWFECSRFANCLFWCTDNKCLPITTSAIHWFYFCLFLNCWQHLDTLSSAWNSFPRFITRLISMVSQKVLSIYGCSFSTLSTIVPYCLTLSHYYLFCLLTCWPIYSPTTRMYIFKSCVWIVYSYIRRTEKIARIISGCSKIICLMRELKERICTW